MSESFAGITVPPGEPVALASTASSWAGMGAALEGAAGRLRGVPAGLGSWQGPASVAFAGASFTASDGISVNGQAFLHAAGVTSRYAHALREARQDARSAIRQARDATERMERARDQLTDAQARAGAAAAAEAFATAEVFATGLTGTPSPSAQADQALAQQARAEAEADAARAQRALDAAEADLEAAKRRGREAEEAAEDAAKQFAGALMALGAAPPPAPPPPPPKPPEEEDRGFFGDIGHGIGTAAGAVKDFTVDTGKGVGDFAVGMKDVAVMGWHLSPVYGAIDPEGHRREVEMLGAGLEYAWDNPGEFGKMMIGWEHIESGHPGRAFGQLLPNIVLTVATAGGGAAAKGAQGVSAASKLSRTADNAGDAGQLAKHADDLPPTTFRGDSRSMEEIFETGFQPRGTDTDLLKYARENAPSAYVGTTRSPQVAVEFAGPGGFRYTIQAPGGIDVNDVLGKDSPFPSEVEVVFEGGIRRDHIVGGNPVGRDLEVGEFVPNPHFRGPGG